MIREKLLRYGKEYLCDLETACCKIGELHLNFVRESIKALEREQCEDAVSRQAVLDKKELVQLEDGQSFYCISPEDVKTLSPVQPKPKTGHWIFDEILDRNYYCSECKSMGVDYWDYCPYCGCRMVEPQESEDRE